MEYKKGDELFIEHYSHYSGSYGTLEHSDNRIYKYYLRFTLNNIYGGSGFYLDSPDRYVYKVVRRLKMIEVCVYSCKNHEFYYGQVLPVSMGNHTIYVFHQLMGKYILNSYKKIYRIIKK